MNKKTAFTHISNGDKYAIYMEVLEVIAMLLLRCAMIDGNVVIITAMTSSSIIIAIIFSKFILVKANKVCYTYNGDSSEESIESIIWNF